MKIYIHQNNIPVLIILLFVALHYPVSLPGKIFSHENSLPDDTILVRTDLLKYFESCHTEGSIVLYDSTKQQWIFSDTVDVKKETLPASTFKIINLLIALETNTIADENEVVHWIGTIDTVKYGYRPEIHHDMTVGEAFRVSAGWVFVELAKKIGKENYRKYLSLCHYGNLDLSHEDADFWNFGPFAISPINQVEFLRNLQEDKLPFLKRNMEIVKKVMQSELSGETTIFSKTGWARDRGINTGWWVGWIKNKKGITYFATRLLQDRKHSTSNFGNCRKEITKAVLKELNILP